MRATGNRAFHVYKAPYLVLRNGAVEARWGQRKIRPANRVALRYPLGWSFLPAPDVRERMEALADWGWQFDVAHPAASLLAWIQRRLRARPLASGNRPTSTSGRALLSGRLHQRILEGKLHVSMFEDLMDHTMETSRSRYQSGLL